MSHKLWFKAKRYGWGWYPSTWQGWAITLGYAVFITIIAVSAEQNFGTDREAFFAILPILIIATVLLLIVCYKLGEKPRWRWGDKK